MNVSNLKFGRQEELLEPFFRKLRFGMSLADVPEHIGTCVDLGCGPTSPYLRFLQAHHKTVTRYIGIDPLLDSSWFDKKENKKGIELQKTIVSDLSGIEDGSVDLVVGFAFLEHIDNPKQVIHEAIRILKPGGKIIFTTPSKIAKPILEFLAFRLHIISPREIAEHKNYFNRSDLMELVYTGNTHFKEVKHTYFEFGCNNYLVIITQ